MSCDPLYDILLLPQLRAGNKEDALKELAEMIYAARPSIKKKQVYHALKAREKLGSTAIGYGTAIPHGKIEDLSNTVICFSRSAEGVTFDAPDNQPVHIFLVLLASGNAAESYLHSLAWASRLLKNRRLHNQLMIVEDDEELRAIFSKVK